ncbi:MAG TPA: translation initiation factor IF-2 [Nitrososphaerales archaeon]|nr:translation initiation factor IF-2 [Nitrososphaerales archaeon]
MSQSEQTKRIRQPVVVVLGHVDSGKTSLLDKIRGTGVQAREVGGITQHIGASFFPADTLKEICGPLLKSLGGGEVRVPGLLVIDTPGHEIFTNLRSRGGSAADISILVVDVQKGLEQQTYESLEILKQRKVPFVVALNKIDTISGWRKGTSNFVTQSIKNQPKSVIDILDEKIYTVVGSLSRAGLNSEALYRVKDFTKEVAIVPVSARTGEGIPELIAVLVGLTQVYLQKRLAISWDTPARGIVLEVKQEPGIGETANIILLEGTLRTGDYVVVAKKEGAISSRIKAIFLPKPLDEMRDPRDKFVSVDHISAAAGVKIVTPDLEGVLAGSPVAQGEESKLDQIRASVESEISQVMIESEVNGVILKADALGSLEALIEMLRARQIPVRRADIGPVTRRDVVEASAVRKTDRYRGAVLAFSVKVLPDAEQEARDSGVVVFSEQIIYNLIDSYLDWVNRERDQEQKNELQSITPLCKFQFLKGFSFRRSDPAVFGIEVLSGRLRQKSTVMNAEGKTTGTIHQLQAEGKSIPEATKSMQVAVSIMGPTIGRQINEGDILYTLPSDHEVKTLNQKFLNVISGDDRDLLKEIVETRRKTTPLYGY